MTLERFGSPEEALAEYQNLGDIGELLTDALLIKAPFNLLSDTDKRASFTVVEKL